MLMTMFTRSSAKPSVFHILSGAPALAVLALLATGCAAVDKAYVGTVGMVDPDQTRLKQETRWLNPQPNLRLVGDDLMTVYVRVRDSSGSDIDISSDLRAALEDRGYRVTRSLNDAQYVLNLDLRYYGENAHADGGRATMAGGLGGAIVGGVIGHQSGRAGGGAMLGGLATGMLFDVAAQRNKIREFDVVIDARIGERVEGGVQTTRSSGDTSVVGHSGSGGNSRGGRESGLSAGGSSESQSVETTEDFLYHQNRLLVFVSKMNLSPDEAQPVLHARMLKALASILP